MTDEEKPARSQSDRTLPAMPLGAHLDELRRRIIRCLLAVGAVFVLCWLLRDGMMAVLARPHRVATQAWGISASLKYLGYFEAVIVQFKAALLVSAVVCSPLIIYNIWAFIAPGLFPRERGKVVMLGAACTACVLAGVGFGYFVFVPLALRFLIGMAGPSMEPMLTIGSYLGTLIMMMMALGVVFQTPVVVFCLVRWGIVKPESLRQHRKPVIFGAFVLGAFLTPPDPMTQIMMAVTLIVLYDLGGIVAAPSRQSVFSALRFSGTVALALAAIGAWIIWWPVATVTVEHGPAEIAGTEYSVDADTPPVVTLRPNSLCKGLADETRVRVDLGKKNPAPFIMMAGATELRVGRKTAALLEGLVLIACHEPDAPITLRAGPLTVIVQEPGRVQIRATLNAPRDRIREVQIHVLSGSALTRDDSGERTIETGRTATYHYGGRPANMLEIEDSWKPQPSPPIE